MQDLRPWSLQRISQVSTVVFGKDLYFYRKREIDTKLDNGEELTDEEVEEQGYLESWRKLEGKNIKQGEVKLQAGLFT